MKKLLAIILSVVLICSMFAACGNEEPSSNLETQVPTENEPQQTEKPTATEPQEDEPIVTIPSDIQQPERPDQDHTESTEPENTGNKFAFGSIKGGVYTNTYAGFKCTLGGKWKFATAKELQELPDNVNELLNDPMFADQLANHLFDMKAENQTDLEAISISYQKLTKSQQLAYSAYTEEEIIDATVADVKTLIEYYTSTGVDVSKIEKVFVSFCGKQRPAILTTASMDGIPYYVIQILESHLGEYQVTITVATFRDNRTQSLINLFSPI